MALLQWLRWLLQWVRAWWRVHTANSIQTTNNILHLPDELIFEIFLRLPVKSLIRYKCICKSWHSLISDPHFATSHFELAAARTKRLALLETKSYAPRLELLLSKHFDTLSLYDDSVDGHELELFLSIDFNASLHDDSACAALNLNFLGLKPYGLHILGSCRGFLLLNCRQNLWVWNPATGVYKRVCHSPNQSFVFLSGFAYDASIDDYLVVQLSYPVKPEVDFNPNCVEIFSLRANVWKEIEDTNFFYSDNYYIATELINHKELFLNGALHWLAVQHYPRIALVVIVAFDSTKRSFSEIYLPRVFVDKEFFCCALTVLGGLLSLCGEIGVGAEPDSLLLEIWVMKEYKVLSSWTKTIVVSLDDIPTGFFYPICSTESGDIVGTDGKDVLMKCNDKGELQERQSYGKPVKTESAVYTESLLSLPCGS